MVIGTNTTSPARGVFMVCQYSDVILIPRNGGSSMPV